VWIDVEEEDVSRVIDVVVFLIVDDEYEVVAVVVVAADFAFVAFVSVLNPEVESKLVEFRRLL